ncbi:hypothetical protein GCM10011343_25230 [Flavobacterium orientale]|uniref:Uncharacterized protein n=1 Tax=Flavobacterium orientale TaxID=1756020 RepID=A0A916Y7P3_9FLAO|nr:hypothetical protein GCM10011343_25230 [Flavobacterium orientale]
MLITNSFDVSLVEIRIISKEGEEIKFDENYTKVDDKVVIECYNFDYMYDYITPFNCFKGPGKKLFHKEKV